MGMTRLCEEIDEKVKAFLGHPLEGDWPYLWIDATYVQVRESGRIVSVAVIVAVAVNSDGRREVLGMDIDPSEAETFWTAFLRKLAQRGVRGVKLMISDAHEGIKAAVAKVLHASWQRRRTCTSSQCARLCRQPTLRPRASNRSSASTARSSGAPMWSGSFPKALLLEQNDEWAVQRGRYMSLETIAP